ncbi:hypothetical protein NE857_34000 (plasmid) [Nocardiopsis exhalans]|uniref:Uncharacterized protein n=1 Tax=Nocardiopsis exhalans TaxID=163604 RepID=A0ABY5DJH7_9ACTN|nr:hypothetical protein [Nocardiopsis exhalans]USY23547.1 hypothetical protein NE857_34000 [Nocardiopsis exhalans]
MTYHHDNGQAASRRIPTTQDELNLITTIVGHAKPCHRLVESTELVPTGALITLHSEVDSYIPNRVVKLLTASGYTAQVANGLTIIVTGVVSRLALLRAERDRLDAEIAAEEERERTVAVEVA